MRLPVKRERAKFLKGGCIHTKSFPREGKFPGILSPGEATSRPDGFPGTTDRKSGSGGMGMTVGMTV